ncbi:hypothetical protein L3X38_019793 [Prunus dulcis]|uniref:Uncharacterized protein n=1 Tax=Prunus dulcis TaxID=3755 RepID=A0AAD4WD96_PRUDU|nr:hypothetical protein L3X38_019793 [Prunus dulcis]
MYDLRAHTYTVPDRSLEREREIVEGERKKESKKSKERERRVSELQSTSSFSSPSSLYLSTFSSAFFQLFLFFQGYKGLILIGG